MHCGGFFVLFLCNSAPLLGTQRVHTFLPVLSVLEFLGPFFFFLFPILNPGILNVFCQNLANLFIVHNVCNFQGHKED